MKKLIFVVLVLAIAATGNAPVFGAAQNVPVTIPQFNVTLNGLEFNPAIFEDLWERTDFWQDEQYPLLLYRGVTYFPMTRNKCNLLNLDVSWTREGGLSVSAGDPVAWKDFEYELQETKNQRSQSAAVAALPVAVNGKRIDNEEEPYPLLTFRDVTYFPLTWRFAVDEFGWDYSFSNETGLEIRADNAVQIFHLPYDGLKTALYSKGGLQIWTERRVLAHTTPDSANLYVSRDGAVRRMGQTGRDWFGELGGINGMDYTANILFEVRGDWVYTVHTAALNTLAVPCRVNISTGEIELLGGNPAAAAP
jgi:hypothetical protein